jgi:hypothetical protein
MKLERLELSVANCQGLIELLDLLGHDGAKRSGEGIRR